MNVITVSREYGAGGGEVARALAAALGWELLDRELLHQAAAVEHVPDAELEKVDEHAARLSDHFRLHPPHEKYLHGLKEAVRQAVARGNVVLVGRGARHLVGDAPGALHLRLVAPAEWRSHRVATREGLLEKQALARCAETDRGRERFLRHFFGAAAARAEQFDLVVNTSRVPLDDVVGAVLALVRGDAAEKDAPGGKRVLTLTGELGAGAPALPRLLGDRLGLRVLDRELLEQDADRLGLSAQEVAKVDEQPAGFFGRWRPGSPHHRYVEALRKLMNDLADAGGALLVGRGGSRILAERAEAFHVRLVAPAAERVREVMAYRWVRANVAEKLMAESDARRQGFYASAFGVDWADPLGYHVTANAGRLGLKAAKVIGALARRHWQRAGPG